MAVALQTARRVAAEGQTWRSTSATLSAASALPRSACARARSSRDAPSPIAFRIASARVNSSRAAKYASSALRVRSVSFAERVRCVSLFGIVRDSVRERRGGIDSSSEAAGASTNSTRDGRSKCELCSSEL